MTMPVAILLLGAKADAVGEREISPEAAKVFYFLFFLSFHSSLVFLPLISHSLQ